MEGHEEKENRQATIDTLLLLDETSLNIGDRHLLDAATKARVPNMHGDEQEAWIQGVLWAQETFDHTTNNENHQLRETMQEWLGNGLQATQGQA